MRSLLRRGIVVALLAWVAMTPEIAGPAVFAQEQPAPEASSAQVDAGLKSRVERRFRVLPLRDGLVLTPRSDVRGLKSIEIRDGIISVDGNATTGSQLRELLEDDADLVLQVSYLAPAALRNWDAPPPPPAPEAPEAPQEREEPEHDEIHWRKSSAKVHIGSSIVVGEEELVTEPVVAVGGSVTVLGRVDDDVVAVGGSVKLGPKARVRGDVTAVGGSVTQEKGSHIGGAVNEVRIGPQFNFAPMHFFDGLWLDGFEVIGDGFRLFGTAMRVSLLVLMVLLVALIAARPVSRIADRAGREPWASGFTGLLAQLLFIPVLVITIVILAVSIIGIPLLLLVPFAIVAFLLAMLVGFAGVALRVGRWAVGAERPVYMALSLGVVIVCAVALLLRVLQLLPLPMWPITWILGLTAFLIEYLAWTVGLGAALLTRFGTRGTSQAADVMPPPLPMAGPTEA